MEIFANWSLTVCLTSIAFYNWLYPSAFCVCNGNR